MPTLLLNRTIIQITGKDASKFLHNLVTGDVLKLQVNDSIYTMMLSHQGRFLFDMFIIKSDEGFLLDIFRGTEELLLKKFNMYKLGLQVTIEKKEGLYVGYSLLNESDFTQKHTIVYKDSRYEMMGYRMIMESKASENDCYLKDKYKFSIVDGGIDLLYDKAMPQEYGAEELHAISYTKGCYIGQEAISRTKTQGVVRKKIYKILSNIDLGTLSHGTEIMSAGKKIGIFTSGYLSEGIALIRQEDLDTAADASTTLEGNDITLELAPWYNFS